LVSERSPRPIGRLPPVVRISAMNRTRPHRGLTIPAVVPRIFVRPSPTGIATSARMPFTTGIPDVSRKLRNFRDFGMTGKVEGAEGDRSIDGAPGDAVRIGPPGQSGKTGAGGNLSLPRRKGALGFCVVNGPHYAA
jgi:hypothetical protein